MEIFFLGREKSESACEVHFWWFLFINESERKKMNFFEKEKFSIDKKKIPFIFLKIFWVGN